MRASSLPLFFTCPSSQMLAEGPKLIDDNPPARLGSAVHEALANMLRHAPVNIQEIATKYRVDEEEVQTLFDAGVQLWEGDKIQDLLKTSRIFVADWKSGFVQTDPRPQLAAYAIGAKEANLEPGRYIEQEVTVEDHLASRTPVPVMGHADVIYVNEKEDGPIISCCIWLRTGHVDVFEYSIMDEDAFVSLFNQLYEKIGQEFAVTESCPYCAHYHTCEAYQVHMRGAIQAVIKYEKAQLTKDRAGDLYGIARQVEVKLKQLKADLKVFVEAEGEIDLGDKMLTIGLRKNKKVDFRASLDVLKRFDVSVDEIADALKVSPTKLAGVVRSTAPEGQKQRTENDLWLALREAGAMEIAESRILTTKKK